MKRLLCPAAFFVLIMISCAFCYPFWQDYELNQEREAAVQDAAYLASLAPAERDFVLAAREDGLNVSVLTRPKFIDLTQPEATKITFTEGIFLPGDQESLVVPENSVVQICKDRYNDADLVVTTPLAQVNQDTLITGQKYCKFFDREVVGGSLVIQRASNGKNYPTQERILTEENAKPKTDVDLIVIPYDYEEYFIRRELGEFDAGERSMGVEVRNAIVHVQDAGKYPGSSFQLIYEDESVGNRELIVKNRMTIFPAYGSMVVIYRVR